MAMELIEGLQAQAVLGDLMVWQSVLGDLAVLGAVTCFCAGVAVGAGALLVSHGFLPWRCRCPCRFWKQEEPPQEEEEEQEQWLQWPEPEEVDIANDVPVPDIANDVPIPDPEPWRLPQPPSFPSKIWIMPSVLENAARMASGSYGGKCNPRRCREFKFHGKDTGKGVSFNLCRHCANLV